MIFSLSMSRSTSATTAFRALLVVITACIIAAIIIQNHTSYFPLGVFNTGAETLHKIADACLIAAGLAFICQVVELTTGALSRPCGVIRGVYVSIAILEALLYFSDQLFVTGNPDGRLGQYYEVAHSGNPPVILKKDFGGRHTFLPCLMNPAPNDSGPRVLFLGDSYTEGSGSLPDCNYPDVVERVLREKWNPNAHVVRAGVSGYGPVEALSLLRWYKTNGCPVQAVVYNMTLQNDFSDNLPRTERRVVAGIIFRFPKSAFLRTFHPLNTRTFRWALVMTYFGKASTHDMLQAVSVAGGPCDLTPKPLTVVSPFLRATVERDLASARRIWDMPHTARSTHVQVNTLPGFKEPLDAVHEMNKVAQEMKVPLFVVLFPDRILVDRELQSLMPQTSLDPAELKYAAALNVGGIENDLRRELSGRAGLYRTVDTHLSDLGNVVAGETVGEWIAFRMTHVSAD